MRFRFRPPCFPFLVLVLVACAPAQHPVQAPQRSVSEASCPTIPPGWEMTDVLVAARNLPSGTKLTSAHVTLGRIPLRYRQNDHVVLRELDEALGRSLARPLQQGDVLSWHALRGHQMDTPPLARTLAPGSRAVTISVDAVSAVGFLIRPGDWVDVAWLPQDARSPGASARLLLQRILVLATGERHLRVLDELPEDRYRTVTLQLLAVEAVLLAQAQRRGVVQLLLRNPTDLGTAPTRSVADPATVPPVDLQRLHQERLRTLQAIPVPKDVPGPGR
jgi:pilus assembly protein CpaB